MLWEKHATAEVKLDFSFIRFQWNKLKLPKFDRELNFRYEVFALIEMCVKHIGSARAFKNYQNMIKINLNAHLQSHKEPTFIILNELGRVPLTRWMSIFTSQKVWKFLKKFDPSRPIE